MNAPLRRLSVAVMLMFGLLLLNVNYLQVVRADALHNDSHNPRLIAEEYARERGPILVAGKPVARSVATDDRLKYLRQYSEGKLYAPVTGFYSLVYGATGIERERNSVLAGTDDSLFVRRIIDLLTGTQPKGGSVALTLNPAAQKAAYDGLRKLGAKGAVVAVDPTTGAILALVSTPSYDPNELAAHDPAVVRANYERLSTAKSRPMLNRAIRQTYPPGSTFKLVTAAAALESGQYTPDTEVDNAAQLDPAADDRRLPNDERSGLRVRHRDADRRAGDLLQHRLRARSGSTSATTRCGRRREVRLQPGVPDPDAQRRQPLPGGPRPAADRAVGDRAVRRAGHPAADGDGRRRRSPTAAC